MSDDRCSTWMWDRTPELWEAIRKHPFVTELEDGTLPDEKLRFYFEQNIQYVDSVYRTRLIAASKAKDPRHLRHPDEGLVSRARRGPSGAVARGIWW